MTDPERRPAGAPPVTPPGGEPLFARPEGAAVRVIQDCTQAPIYRQAQRLLVRSLAGISVAFGLALLIGGRGRFESTPTFAYAAAMPGSYVTWGVAALATGVWTFVASFRWHRVGVMVGLLIQCVVFSFFTVSIFVSAVEDPTTPFTGVVIYGGYSLICAIAYGAGNELRKAER